MDMYLICIVKKRGVDIIGTILLAENVDLANAIKTNPGVGKPYFVFNSLPDGNPIGVDFADAPIVNLDASVNQTNIDNMLADPPWDALAY